GAAGHKRAQGIGHRARGVAHLGAPGDGGGRDQGFRRVRHLGRARRRGREARRHRDRGGLDLPRRGHQIPGLPGHPRGHDPARRLERVPPRSPKERRRHGRPGDDQGSQDDPARGHPGRGRHGHGREPGKDPARHGGGRRPARRRHPHGHPHPPRPQPPPL
ncbi:MAG: CBS domain protein sometimes clustered with YjeE, partial [uncultured Rubrobacteraceae bacterium]